MHVSRECLNGIQEVSGSIPLVSTNEINTLTDIDTVYNTIYETKGNITVNPGPVNPGLSTVTAGKSTVTANNTDSSTIHGASKDNFVPAANITRADYLVLLVKTDLRQTSTATLTM